MDISNTWDMEKKTLNFKKSICNEKNKRKKTCFWGYRKKKVFPFFIIAINGFRKRTLDRTDGQNNDKSRNNENLFVTQKRDNTNPL